MMKKFLCVIVMSIVATVYGATDQFSDVTRITNSIQSYLHDEESNFSFLESLYLFIGKTINKLDSKLIKSDEEDVYTTFKTSFQKDSAGYNFLDDEARINYLRKFKEERFDLIFSVFEKITQNPELCNLDALTELIDQMNDKNANNPTLEKISREESTVDFFDEELITGDNNQCGFASLGITREEGIQLIEDHLENHLVNDIIASEIHGLLIAGEFERFVRDEEKRSTIKTFIENEAQENDLKACAFDLIQDYLDYVKNNPVMLQIHPGGNCPLLIDIIAALKGYTLNVYIQEEKANGFMNLDLVKKWHTFDPSQFGFSCSDGFKEHNILFTSFGRRSIFSGLSGNWRDHFNILHKRV
ncbi:MAG: hypothetical protein NEHIOOID_00194 [Holosporales bacterium]